jgi:hypothetical protein
VNKVMGELAGSIAIPKSALDPKREKDGFVRLGVDVVFHLDVLKLTLRNGDACNAPCNAKAKKQMSLDLEDLY